MVLHADMANARVRAANSARVLVFLPWWPSVMVVIIAPILFS
jgi:hypothetical protein